MEDLDGEPILLHSRGGGTDSIANVIEDEAGIEFGDRSYVPGSANRVAALIAGQADATIIDLSNKNKIMRQYADKFNVLPMFEVDASDEALFANLDWIKANEEQVQIFVNALLSVWQDMIADPTIVRRETNPDGPIGQLPHEILDSLDNFYAEAVEGGLYDPNGGGRKAAMADLEWYSNAGQLEGRAIPLSGKGVTGACSAAHFGEHFPSECQAGPRGAAVDPAAGKPAPVAGTRSRQKNGPELEGDMSTLNIEDFWYMAPLDAAMN